MQPRISTPYQLRSVAATVGAILVAAVDAKGVPMVKLAAYNPKPG